jgi:UDP-N-acetylglucosamine 2-epimerase (non-hydrolysing)
MRKTLEPADLTGPMAILTGTRPGVIKFSPILRELDRRQVPYVLVHSGQHYSPDMDAVFFEQLHLRQPDHKLDIVRHHPLHGEQTAEMLRGIEEILLRARPRLLVVGGDCNTHLAGAIAARKLHIPIAHVEAGMRSYDWRMPEEHNRVMIDHISEHLFVHDESAAQVLRDERCRGLVYVVGSTIVDAVAENLEIARTHEGLLRLLGIERKRYVLTTIHREENVEDTTNLDRILTGLRRASAQTGLGVVMPLHPGTKKRAEAAGIELNQGLVSIPPQGYLEFLFLLENAAAVVTDSGGVQQEACILGVPCVTVRDSTEWVETLRVGANRLTTTDPESVSTSVIAAFESDNGWTNPFISGSASRIVETLTQIREANAQLAGARFGSPQAGVC